MVSPFIKQILVEHIEWNELGKWDKCEQDKAIMMSFIFFERLSEMVNFSRSLKAYNIYEI